MEQNRFLERVRSSLGRDKGSVSSLELTLPAGAERPSSPDPLCARLARELEQVGGVVHRVSSTQEARAVIGKILGEHDVKRAVVGNTPLIRELDLNLNDVGVELTVCDLRQDVPRRRIRDAELEADVGITSADYGIAETGTLALLAAPGQGRGVSLLPPIHIGVLRSSNIVYELSELFTRVEREHEKLPSALTFITGPSRTADIELVLTVGVHGPKYLYLVLIDAI